MVAVSVFNPLSPIYPLNSAWELDSFSLIHHFLATLYTIRKIQLTLSTFCLEISLGQSKSSLDTLSIFQVTAGNDLVNYFVRTLCTSSFFFPAPNYTSFTELLVLANSLKHFQKSQSQSHKIQVSIKHIQSQHHLSSINLSQGFAVTSDSVA